MKYLESDKKAACLVIVVLIFAFNMLNAQTNPKTASPVTKTTEKADILTASIVVAGRPEDISPLLTGEKVPEAVLNDVAGEKFDLYKAIEAKPTILVFYRGGWCPYCSKQLSGLQSLLPELQQQGYQLLAISTDKPESLAKSRDKQQLSYTLLSDADLDLAKQFGIAYKAPEAYWKLLPESTGGKDEALLLPVPSVFIVDRQGRIQFEYINPDFRQRLDPDVLKAVATAVRPSL